VVTNVRYVREADIYTVANEINRARGKNTNALVVLKADKDASFGTMQAIMKSMQEKQLQRFLIITEMEEENTPGS
jgi:biopolymer transport protein ExbD